MSTTVALAAAPSGAATWKLTVYYPTKDSLLYTWEGPISQAALMDMWPSYPLSAYISVVVHDSLGYVIYQAYKLGPFFMRNYQAYSWNCALDALQGGTSSAASIVTKRLQYDSLWGDIPVASVPLNSQARVSITARNNWDSPIYMGISFTVTGPDGLTLQTVSDQAPAVQAGQTFLFGWYPTFPLSQVGIYKINNIMLYFWGGSDYLIADMWSGDLCTVLAGQLPAPGLVSPANGGVVSGTSVIFRWGAVSGAANYRLYIEKAGVAIINQLVGNVTQFTVPGFVNDGVAYSWKVATVDNAGNQGAWSTIWTFINGVAQPGTFSNLAVSYVKV